MLYYGLAIFLNNGTGKLRAIAQDQKNLPKIPFHKVIRLHKIGDSWATESFIATKYRGFVNYGKGKFLHTNDDKQQFLKKSKG